jgi:hypothetical protein
LRNRVILIEFNELTPRLLSQFMADGTLPHFKKFFDSSTVFTTRADDAQLNPWVVWPTIHSGVPASEHGIAHMGDGGLNLAFTCVAQELSAKGIRVGVFGSMNVNYGALSGYYVPDPWDKRGHAHPAFLDDFYRIVAQQVKDSSRYAIDFKQLFGLATFLLRHGLTLGTAFAAARQLLVERTNRHLRWRRAMILDRISYDVFRFLNGRLDVEFATFFSNSTAHFQHFYWSDMEPEAFTSAPPSANSVLAGAIREGYESMDELLRRMMLDNPSATLMLCTGLSQGPRGVADQFYYRLADYKAFLTFAGLSLQTHRITVAMSSEFHIHCETESEAARVGELLSRFSVDDSAAFNVAVEESKVVVSPRASADPARLDKSLMRDDGASVRFGAVAHARREGALWIRNGDHRIIEGEVPVTDIAPTLLKLFNVAQPDHMKGRPLLPVATEAKDYVLV